MLGTPAIERILRKILSILWKEIPPQAVSERPGCACLKEVGPSRFLHYQDRSPGGLQTKQQAYPATDLMFPEFKSAMIWILGFRAVSGENVLIIRELWSNSPDALVI